MVELESKIQKKSNLTEVQKINLFLNILLATTTPEGSGDEEIFESFVFFKDMTDSPAEVDSFTPEDEGFIPLNSK